MASISSDNVNNDYNFINEPEDDLKCLICLGVARDPLQHEECGKLFCKKCLEKFGRAKPCPNCRMKWSHYYADKRSKRAIEALRVKCHNAERSCEWEGTVGTVEGHISTCQFTPLPCPYQCISPLGEVQYFLKKNLDDHLKKDCNPNRLCKCQYCGEEGMFNYINYLHDVVCDKKIVPCPNAECTDAMQRYVVDKHVKYECSHTKVHCKYESIGCSKKIKRRDRAAHEQDDRVHLHMAMETTLKLSNDNEQLKSEVAELKRDLRSAINILQLTLQAEPQTYKLTDYQERKENGEAFTFPAFYTHPPHCYHVALQVVANGDTAGEGAHITVRMPILQGEYDAKLKWPLLGITTFTLLNQLEDRNHHVMVLSLTRGDNARVGDNWGVPEFIPHSALGHDPIKNTQYLKDDTLYFRVSVEVEGS